MQYLLFCRASRARRYTLEQTSSCTVGQEPGKRFAKEFADRTSGKGDLTIVVNNEATRVHRAVLMQRSEYFKTMFSGSFSESNAASIDLSELFDHVDDANAVLDFIYTECITLTEQNIASVVNASCLFLLPENLFSELQNACSEFLITNIAPCTCINIFLLADRFSMKYVRNACIEVIKAWFPYMLWSTTEALDLPPESLKNLIEEGVVKFMPDDLKDKYFTKWYQRYENGSGDAASIPKEVKDHLKPKQSDKTTEETHGAFGKLDREQMEDVLLTVMSVAPAESERCCIEVHAFSPKIKSWKCVLRHAFSKLVKPDVEPKILGIRNGKAFFVFKHCELMDSEDGCVIVIDIQSKREYKIKLPSDVCTLGFNSYSNDAHYFFWNSHLCAIFKQKDGEFWLMFRNDHDGCKDCDGKCWHKILEFTYAFQYDCLDLYNRNEFITKEIQKDLYLWTKESVYSYFEDYSPRMEHYIGIMKKPSPQVERHLVKIIRPDSGNVLEGSTPSHLSIEDECENPELSSQVHLHLSQRTSLNKPDPVCSADKDVGVNADHVGRDEQHNAYQPGLLRSLDQSNSDEAHPSDTSDECIYNKRYDPLKPMTWYKKSVCEVIQLADAPQPPKGYMPADRCSRLSTVSADPVSKTLKFTHFLKESELESWRDTHVYQILTFDLLTNTWEQSELYETYYPGIRYGFKMGRPPKHKTSIPVVLPSRRLVRSRDDDDEVRSTGRYVWDSNASMGSLDSERMSSLDSEGEERELENRITDTGLMLDRFMEREHSMEDHFNVSVRRFGPQICIGAEGFAKSTSPYCTYIWKLNPEEESWQVVTILPLSLYKFPYFQTGEMSCDLLRTLPNSCFEDFSETIGQSEVACFAARESLAEVSFTHGVLNRKAYDERWARCWVETFNSD